MGAVEYDLEREEKALGFIQRLKEGSCALRAADVRDVAGPTDVAEDQPLVWEAAFHLADKVPYGLETDSAGLRWSIRVQVAAPMRRDLVRGKPVVVRP